MNCQYPPLIPATSASQHNPYTAHFGMSQLPTNKPPAALSEQQDIPSGSTTSNNGDTPPPVATVLLHTNGTEIANQMRAEVERESKKYVRMQIDGHLRRS